MAFTGQLGTLQSQLGNLELGLATLSTTPASPALVWATQAAQAQAGATVNPAAAAATWALGSFTLTASIAPAAAGATWQAQAPGATVGVRASPAAAAATWAVATLTPSGAATATCSGDTLLLTFLVQPFTVSLASAATPAAADLHWALPPLTAQGGVLASPSSPGATWAAQATATGAGQANPATPARTWTVTASATTAAVASPAAATASWTVSTVTAANKNPLPWLAGCQLQGGFWEESRTVMYTFNPGAVSQTIHLFVRDSVTGTPLTGLTATSAGANFHTTRKGGSPAALSLVALGSPTAVWQSGGFVELGQGVYRLDLPDAALAVGAPFATLAYGFTGALGDAVLLLLQTPASNVGAGAQSFTVTVNNTATGNPLAGAEVWVTTDAPGSNVVAGTLTTNSLGQATFLLDAGPYYLWCADSGFQGTNPTAFSV